MSRTVGVIVLERELVKALFNEAVSRGDAQEAKLYFKVTNNLFEELTAQGKLSMGAEWTARAADVARRSRELEKE